MSSSVSVGGSAIVSKPATASGVRTWAFRVLIVAAGALMFVSWIMPWWRAIIFELDRWVAIRPWGLEHNLGDFADYIKTAAMPTWFAPLMWAYLGVSILVLLFSLFSPEKALRLGKFEISLPQLLIVGVGLSYIVVVIVAVVYGSMRMDEFWHLQLIGKTHVVVGEIEESDVEAGLLLGYWLACVTGPLLVFLGLFRNRIVGNSAASK